MGTDKCTPQYFFEKNFKVTIPQRTFWQSTDPFDPEDIVVYTDGSKTDNKSGAGIFSFHPSLDISHSLGSYTSITLAETYAIITTCKELKSMNTNHSNINICTDSQASLKADHTVSPRNL